MENWKEHNDKENKGRKEQESEEREKYSPSTMQRTQDAQMKKYMGDNNLGGNMKMPNIQMPKMPKW